MNDWVVLAAVLAMGIMGVTQLYINARTKQKMEHYIVEFHTLKGMYSTLVLRVKDLNKFNDDVLAHTTEVIDNDRSILNDVNRLMAETEKLHDCIRAGISNKTVGSDTEPGE